MCLGIAVPIHEIPDAMIKKHRLADRFAQRDVGAGREIQFLYRNMRRLLPVYLDNQLRILEWGNRNGNSPLPDTGWCHREWIESGHWQGLRPQPAIIVAAMALDRGLWFQIKEGIKCVVVRNHVYMLTEPATHYYRIMTRSNRMPVLIGQTI
ncbi:MAG TPA: hypothetical protein VMJ32_17250 [Pirellulales bacterium]|nr:hypothetical protein [Pirellulales bacterium]